MAAPTETTPMSRAEEKKLKGARGAIRAARRERQRARLAAKRGGTTEETAPSSSVAREPPAGVLKKWIEKRETAGPIGRMMEMELERQREAGLEVDSKVNEGRMTVLEAWEREVEVEKMAGAGTAEAERGEAAGREAERRETERREAERMPAKKMQAEREQAKKAAARQAQPEKVKWKEAVAKKKSKVKEAKTQNAQAGKRPLAGTQESSKPNGNRPPLSAAKGAKTNLLAAKAKPRVLADGESPAEDEVLWEDRTVITYEGEIEPEASKAKTKKMKKKKPVSPTGTRLSSEPQPEKTADKSAAPEAEEFEIDLLAEGAGEALEAAIERRVAMERELDPLADVPEEELEDAAGLRALERESEAPLEESKRTLWNAPKPVFPTHAVLSAAKKGWLRQQIKKMDGEIENNIRSVVKYVSLMDEKVQRRREHAKVIRQKALEMEEKMIEKIVGIEKAVKESKETLRSLRKEGSIIRDLLARRGVLNTEERIQKSQEALDSLDEEVVRVSTVIRALRAGLAQLRGETSIVTDGTTEGVYGMADQPRSVGTLMDEILSSEAKRASTIPGQSKEEDKQQRKEKARRQQALLTAAKPPNEPSENASTELVRRVRPPPVRHVRWDRKGEGVEALLEANKNTGENPLVRFHFNNQKANVRFQRYHTSARLLDRSRALPASGNETASPPSSTASSASFPSSAPTMPSSTTALEQPTATSSSNPKTPHLTHLTPAGTAHMVSITSKPPTHRLAIAVGEVLFSNPDPARLIAANALKKGDVLAVARIAGIMAAKATPALIPLCHPIQITKVAVDVVLDESLGDSGVGGVRIEARVECQGQTGVEMEALTAVSVAALTVFDMCKGVDRGMEIGGLRVVRKSGGMSGEWVDGKRREGGS